MAFAFKANGLHSTENLDAVDAPRRRASDHLTGWGREGRFTHSTMNGERTGFRHEPGTEWNEIHLKNSELTWN